MHHVVKTGGEGDKRFRIRSRQRRVYSVWCGAAPLPEVRQATLNPSWAPFVSAYLGGKPLAGQTFDDHCPDCLRAFLASCEGGA